MKLHAISTMSPMLLIKTLTLGYNIIFIIQSGSMKADTLLEVFGSRLFGLNVLNIC